MFKHEIIKMIRYCVHLYIVLVHFYLFSLLIYRNNKTDAPKYNFYMYNL